MFEKDQRTSKLSINKKYLRRIHDYNMIKALVMATSEDGNQINLLNLVDLVNQVYQKQAIYEHQHKKGILYDSRDLDEIFKHNIYEFLAHRAKDIRQSVVKIEDITIESNSKLDFIINELSLLKTEIEKLKKP
jgi:hypothetical protein